MFTYLADTTDPVATLAAGITGVIVLALGLALLVLLVAAVVSTLVHKDTTGGGKLLWIIFEISYPLFGPVAWFVVGRKGHLNRILGIAKNRSRHSAPPSVGQHSDVSNDQNGLGHA
ncbi:PLD nuclease N-terminal domain-containing protein [Nocardiopsis sp. NPDC049922]|uniref:PLD nuclease N-terminal domain-containing protein n=1 Tax=Nocardiopsis sp. NPDC049922 TaxID=3155157 RepID=UPI00340F7036